MELKKKKKAWQKVATEELIRKEKESSVERWKGPIWMMMGKAPCYVPCSSSGSWWTGSCAVPGRGSEEEVKAGLTVLGVSLSDCLLLVLWMASVGRARRSCIGRFCDLMSPRLFHELLSCETAGRDSWLGISMWHHNQIQCSFNRFLYPFL